MTRASKRIGLAAAVLALAVTVAISAFAQRGGFGGGFGGGIGPPSGNLPTFPALGEFHFIRTEYTDLPGRGRGFGSRGNGWWRMDWPEADYHFSEGIRRLTKIDTGEPLHLSLTDDRLFDNPWIYATQVGWWGLNNAEIERLREFLTRGGFLVVDDFWSQDPDSWPVFAQTMERTLPGHQIVEMAETDPAMHVLYDIQDKDRVWIPGSRHLRLGANGVVQPIQPPGTTPMWFSIADDKNRMVVAINYNTDVADAWEFADVSYYPEQMTQLAYRYGLNYIIYAMTH